MLLLALTPVPGGCNLEFNMENDPNFHLSYQSDITDVKYQWGSSSTKDDSCEKSAALTQMSYLLYVYYIGDNDNDLSQQALLDGVSKMTTVENIQENGKTVSIHNSFLCLNRAGSIRMHSGILTHF